MGPHSNGNPYQNIVRFITTGRRIKTRQGAERRRSFRNHWRLSFNELDIGAFQDRNVGELCGRPVAAILHYKQSRTDNLKDKAPRWNSASDPPNVQFVIV